MIQVENLSFSYGSHPVLQNVSFSLEQGECVAVLGNNGAGKSTLISCVGRLRKPSSGSVVIDGIPVSRLSRNQLALQVAYVAQKNELARSTVFDAVLLGRKPHMKWGPSAVDYDVAEHALRAVGMEECRLRYIHLKWQKRHKKHMLQNALHNSFLLHETGINVLASVPHKESDAFLRNIWLVRAVRHQYRVLLPDPFQHLHLALKETGFAASLHDSLPSMIVGRCN